MRVIDRWGNYDSVLYLQYLVSKRDSSSGYGWDYSFIHDTVYTSYIHTQVIKFNNPERRQWNSAPGETYFFNDNATTYKINSSFDSLYKTKVYFEPQVERISDSCYDYRNPEKAGTVYCIKGAGDNYYNLTNVNGGHMSIGWRNLLVYYKKADKTWGTPLDFSKVNKPGNSIDSSISVYPNPVEEILVFNLHNLPISGLSICFFNSVGLRLMEIPLTEQKVNLNVKYLIPGIYFYLINSSLITSTGKFIKI